MRRGGRHQRHAKRAGQVLALAETGLHAVDQFLAGGHGPGNGVHALNFVIQSETELLGRMF